MVAEAVLRGQYAYASDGLEELVGMMEGCAVGGDGNVGAGRSA